jgi:hypothetical protein
MHTLATGVGDLKRVLTNVTVRGTWAEVQLGTILEQFLAVDQYSKNVRVKEGAAEFVEYAIRLPGKDNDPTSPVWLPIDSKFPQEDYQRLVEAGDAERVLDATTALARTVRTCAEGIRTKLQMGFATRSGVYREQSRPDCIASSWRRRRWLIPDGARSERKTDCCPRSRVILVQADGRRYHWSQP